MKLTKNLKIFRRRYREPVIKRLFSVFTYLPLRISHSAGRVIGLMLWYFNGEMRDVSTKNLNACFPNKNKEAIDALCKASLVQTGKTMMEVPALWQWNQNKLENLVQQVNGLHLIKEAQLQNRGVIIIAPHLGAWELIGVYLSIHFNITSMYRPPEMSSLENIVRSGRSRFGAFLVATDTSGVRALLKSLKNTGLAGILPDQDPGPNGGEFAAFFGVQANTGTLALKLAQKTGASVIGAYAKRLPDGKGFDIEFLAANEAINDTNTSLGLSALNQLVENLILDCPEQYQWSYKRFKTRPEAEQKFY